MTTTYADILSREIVTTRIFDVPCATLFAAWTNPDQVQLWWGPRGFTNTFESFSITPGGEWKFTMHAPNGQSFPNLIQVIEVSEPERIVLDHTSHPHFRLTILFDDLGAQAKLTFRQLFESPAVYDAVKSRAIPGNEDNLLRLAQLLELK